MASPGGPGECRPRSRHLAGGYLLWASPPPPPPQGGPTRPSFKWLSYLFTLEDGCSLKPESTWLCH